MEEDVEAEEAFKQSGDELEEGEVREAIKETGTIVGQTSKRGGGGTSKTIQEIACLGEANNQKLAAKGEQAALALRREPNATGGGENGDEMEWLLATTTMRGARDERAPKVGRQA